MVTLPRPRTRPSLRQVRLPREQVMLARDINRVTIGPVKKKKKIQPAAGMFGALDVKEGIL